MYWKLSGFPQKTCRWSSVCPQDPDTSTAHVLGRINEFRFYVLYRVHVFTFQIRSWEREELFSIVRRRRRLDASRCRIRRYCYDDTSRETSSPVLGRRLRRNTTPPGLSAATCSGCPPTRGTASTVGIKPCCARVFGNTDCAFGGSWRRRRSRRQQ